MKKNILIISYYFPPKNAIASHRAYSWAKYWSGEGNRVTVLTVKHKNEKEALEFNYNTFDVIRIENTFAEKIRKSPINSKSLQNTSKSKSSLKSRILSKLKGFLYARGAMMTSRMPSLNDFIVKKSIKALEGKGYFDLCISTHGPYTGHLIALQLKKRGQIGYWVADYRDLWTQNHIYKGVFPFTLLEEHLEKRINRTADMITTVSAPLAEKIKSKYHLENVAVIENGFDDNDLRDISKKPYWNDDKIRIAYTGTIYKGRQDPSPLFEALSRISKSSDSYLLENLEIVFSGKRKGDLHELIEKHGVGKWVKDIGYVSRSDSLRIQRDAHALLFLEFGEGGEKGILSGKIYEYLFSGTQILCIGTKTKNGAGEFLERTGQGIDLGRDIGEIESYLIELLKDRKKQFVKINHKILSKYTRRNLAKKLLHLIEEEL